MSEKVMLIDPATGLPYRASGGSGGGGGGDASAANQTATQANPGVNSSKADGVQGVDGGKPVSVAGTVVTGDQAYAIGSVNPLNQSPDGRLKVGLSAAGNIAPAAKTASNNNALLTAGTYLATRPTWSDGWTGALQVSARGDLFVDNTVPGMPTPRSGTITAGGTAQEIMPANPTRRHVFVQNRSTGSLYLRFTGTAANDETSWELAPGAAYENPPNFCPNGAVSIFGATTGQRFNAREA